LFAWTPQETQVVLRLGSVSPAPVNIVAPVITGSGLVGQTLLTSNGTWLYVPSSYTHQWKRDGVDIAGETGTTYLLVSGDVGKNITCVTTATNSTGSTPATSNSIGPIASAGALSSTNAVQTNPAGTAPFTFSVIMGSDIYPGFYLDIERSNASTVNGSGNYTTTTLVLSHQITEQDRTDSYVTTASLSADTYTQPASGTTFYEHYRWRREDGTVGPWTQLTDSINASTATLTPSTGSSKSSFLTVTNSNLTFTGTGGVGAYQGDRATAATSGTTIQFEVTIGTVVGSSWFLIGLDDGTSNLNSGFPGPGYTNSAGIAIRMHPDEVKVFWNNQANSLQFQTTAGMVATGDVYTFRFDLTNHTLDVWRTRSGSTTKIGAQCTGLPTLSAYYLFVAPLVQQSGTVNFGGQTFSKALDNGYAIYG
jgi:hypothetical protein